MKKLSEIDILAEVQIKSAEKELSAPTVNLRRRSLDDGAQQEAPVVTPQRKGPCLFHHIAPPDDTLKAAAQRLADKQKKAVTLTTRAGDGCLTMTYEANPK